jgi:hypothetical protein
MNGCSNKNEVYIMHKSAFWAVCLTLLMSGIAVVSEAKPHIYQWVKDKGVSSDQVLKEANRERLLSLPEAQAVKAVRGVMADDLRMVLEAFNAARHRQSGQIASDVVLPEAIVKNQEVLLIGENFKFVLEVRFKAKGEKTAISVSVSPMYRIRDRDKEDERDGTDQSGSSIEIKARAANGGVVAMTNTGYITPLVGLPLDYQVETLPDAADRAGKLVRSFLFFLEQRLTKMETQP